MSLATLFTDHPATVGETYGEHFAAAGSFAAALLAGGIVCLVHAFLPFLFVKTGSSIVAGLYRRMVTGRHRSPRPAVADGEIVLNFEI